MYIKSLYLTVLAAVLLAFAAPAPGQPKDDIQMHKECKYCGMDREKFNFSRMLIEYEDGSSAAVCSLHCAAVESANAIDRTPKAIWVGDMNSRQLIDAEKALWVMGGSKPGVMSKRGKWAFAKKEEADDFLKQNGGTLVTFEEAIKAAYEDMNSDTKMIREKRRGLRTKQQGQGHQH